MRELTWRKSPGFTKDQDGESCEGCAAGKYKIGPGTEACSLCPGKTNSPTASISYSDCEHCPAESLCLFEDSVPHSTECTCDRRKGAREVHGSCRILEPIDLCEISFNHSTSHEDFTSASKISLHLKIRTQTELENGDLMSLVLPGFHGNLLEKHALSVEPTGESRQYHLMTCQESLQCRGSQECYNESMHSHPESTLEATWSAEKEMLTFIARTTILVGSELTVDLANAGFFLRTPQNGLSANSPLITIASSKDRREVPNHLKRLAICSIPKVKAPEPKQHIIDQGEAEAIADIPGDSEAKIEVPSSTFGDSLVELELVVTAFDNSSTPVASVNTKPVTGVLQILARGQDEGVETNEVEYKKPLKVTLSISKAGLAEFLAIIAGLSGRRSSQTAELLQHYFDQEQQAWRPLAGSIVDKTSGTVTGDVPIDVLNSPAFSGELTVQ